MPKDDRVITKQSAIVTRPRQEKALAKRHLLRCIQTLRDCYAAYRRRHVLLALLSCDDHILEDIGHTRQRLMFMANLPLGTKVHQKR